MHVSRSVALAALAFSVFTSPVLHAQSEEGLVPTQALVRAESKNGARPDAASTRVELDGKQTSLTDLTPVTAANAQVALLIDDGLSRSAGVQLGDLRAFAQSLPSATELLVGYLSNGTVRVVAPFSTDHAAAAKAIRLPFSLPGISASPYFCLSAFVKAWPGSTAPRSLTGDIPADALPEMPGKARFVIMLTNGVDPYNGSTSPLNQNSPYVDAAVTDSQRAGVAVYSIYYSNAGMRGGYSSFSGQSYLSQVADGTGGLLFNQVNPVSLKPYFKQFQKAMLETYIATFPAESGKRNKLVRLKMSTEVPSLKLHHPDQVRPGNVE